MKMYHFSSGSYSAEYHVMAPDATLALMHLKKYCFAKASKELRQDLLYYGRIKDYVFPNDVTYPNENTHHYETEMDGIQDQLVWIDYETFAAHPEFTYEFCEGKVLQTEDS